LQNRKGSGRSAIKTWIEDNYSISAANSALRAAFKKGVDTGKLSQDGQRFKVVGGAAATKKATAVKKAKAAPKKKKAATKKKAAPKKKKAATKKKKATKKKATKKKKK